jgi:hypothetical protein
MAEHTASISSIMREVCGFNSTKGSEMKFDQDWITLPGPASIWEGLSEREWQTVGQCLDAYEEGTKHLHFDIRSWLQWKPAPSLFYEGQMRIPVGFDFPVDMGNILLKDM